MGRTFKFLATFALLASVALPAFAIEATGEGATKREALEDAMRTAVERTLGTEIESRTLVEDFEVVEQSIVAHARGYISDYTILNHEILGRGHHLVEIDAEVEESRLARSASRLEGLSRDIPRPRVMVVGSDDGFQSISALLDDFDILTRAVERTLADEFDFVTLNSERARRRDINPYRFTDERNLLKRGGRADVDVVVFVSIDGHPQSDFRHGLKLSLRAVDVQSGKTLSRQSHPLDTVAWQDQGFDRRLALKAAKETVYPATTDLAHSLIDHLIEETAEDATKYTIRLKGVGLEDQEDFMDAMEKISGFVDMSVERRTKKRLVLSYLSTEENRDLYRKIDRILQNSHLDFRARLKGRSIRINQINRMFH